MALNEMVITNRNKAVSMQCLTNMAPDIACAPCDQNMLAQIKRLLSEIGPRELS